MIPTSSSPLLTIEIVSCEKRLETAVTSPSIRSISVPGVYSGGLPALEATLWRRLAARFKRLELLAGRVRRLERDPSRTSLQD